ncbi:MAG: hypothetical protein KA760_16300, partial [Steroidobacteraceae bacterium]|nr:hypothetical protein [Steroidobacteraceae bacterium]
ALGGGFDRRRNRCRLTRHGRLRRALKGALDAYLAELDGVTIEDISVRTTSGGRSLPMIAVPGPG